MENSKSITYTFEDIKRYRQGLMSKAEMHAFEKASMEDPFLADALEGYMEADIALADQHLGNIKEKIAEKEEKKEQAVVVPMQKRSFSMLKVAAMVILIAGAGLITFKVLDNKKAGGDETEIAKVTPENKPVNSTSTDAGLAAVDTNSATVNTKTETQAPTVTYHNTTTETPKKTNDQIASLQQTKKSEAKDALRDETEAKNAEVATDVEVVTANGIKRNNQGYSVSKINANEIRGNIVTPSNEPLANANLRVDNSRKEVVTDDAGNFVISSKDTVVNATITNGAYKNTTVKLKANSANNINLGTIQLKTDTLLEKSIAVINLGSSKWAETDTSKNKPIGGWSSFRSYVSKKLGIAMSDSLEDTDYYANSTEIELVIGSNGQAKEVKVINTTDESKTRQIIEAIKKGPKWANHNKTRLVLKY